jgi:hypothetical protein
MRSAAWCWLTAGTWLLACSGGYPLAPTACDNYCHSTKDLQCAFYDPSGCVSQCERDLKGDAACREQLSAVLSCFETNDAAARRCRAYASYPPNMADAVLCEAVIGELEICSSSLRIANAPQPPQPQPPQPQL